MTCQRSIARLALAALLSWAGAAAAQSASFAGWTLAGGWPVSQMSARADWSSDLGADWIYAATSAPDGSSVSWSGQGRTWSSRPGYSNSETDIVVGWELDARGGAVGETYAGGELTVGPAKALDGGAVSSHTVHLWNVLGDNAAGYGISTEARHVGYAAIFLGPQPLNLHWRLDWSSTASGNAIHNAYLYFAGAFSQAIGGTAGSAQGSWAYNGSSQGIWIVPDLQLSASNGDNAGDPRTGRLDTWVTVSFSTQPIAAPVPEPAGWALMAGGLLLVGAVVRRRPR